MPSWGSHNYGYGSEGGEQEGVAAHAGPPPPPVPVQEPKKAGRNQVIQFTYNPISYSYRQSNPSLI